MATYQPAGDSCYALIQNLMAEIDINLALVGAHSIRDLDRTWVATGG